MMEDENGKEKISCAGLLGIYTDRCTGWAEASSGFDSYL